MVIDNSFAVIIPVYNAGCFLSDCLDSLFSQKYENWNAYCVDDGSSDSSGEILDDYAKKDPRIKVFHKENRGVSSARNYALDRIGDEQWVAFLDADDYFSPNFFSDIINAINNTHNHDKIDYIRLYPQRTNNRYSKMGEWNSKPDAKQLYYAVSNTDYFKKENVGGFVASMLVKAEIIKNQNIRFVETMKILEDQVFSIECATFANMILMYPGDYYFYYSNNNSATKMSIDRSNDIIQCINNVNHIFLNNNNPVFYEYYSERFLPPKIHSLLNERFKYILSKPSYKLYGSFKVFDIELSVIDIIKYYVLRVLDKI